MKTKAIMISGLIIFLLSFFNTPSFSQVHQHEAPAKEEAATEEADEEKNTVEIELEKQQLIGVKTIAAAVQSMRKTIRTVGRVEYDERRLATVNTKFEGWIEKLYVDYTGKYVKKGEPLAEIYSPELVATQQEFLNVLKWAKQSTDSNPPSPTFAKGVNTPLTPLDRGEPSPPLEKGDVGVFSDKSLSDMLSKDAERIVDAARQRLKLWDITDEQIKTIEESGKPIRTLTIYSPADGYVVQKMAIRGMRVMPGEKLFDLADLSTVWVISDIYEYELAFIKVGQTASISLSYFPGRQFTSTIDYIYPELSSATRTAKVRFVITNPSAQLKPQMFTSVEIKIDMGKRLVIPEEAVIDTGTRQIIYVDKGEGYFQPREVHLGLKADGLTEVLHGVEAGEKVAASGMFLIDSEAQLKGVKPVKLQ
ncbi:MAG: efflux RND transporter periplasmic adaptor subunit [Nitrospirae bacterium]|nr:efflux RND transporter periplasmic adaptor subunit [Nitrospirota bacterium]